MSKNRYNKKALVKKTGEVLDVLSEYKTFTIELTMNTSGWEKEEGVESKSSNSNSIVSYEYGKEMPKGNYYILSDEKEYNEDELIVGAENIRDLNINDFLNEKDNN